MGTVKQFPFCGDGCVFDSEIVRWRSVLAYQVKMTGSAEPKTLRVSFGAGIAWRFTVFAVVFMGDLC